MSDTYRKNRKEFEKYKEDEEEAVDFPSEVISEEPAEFIADMVNIDPSPIPESKVVATKNLEGFVINCTNLRVREEPTVTAEVITTIPFRAKVMVDLNESTEDFYKVYNSAGIEGYCMKKFIETKG